jgi:hypothetical protein
MALLSISSQNVQPQSISGAYIFKSTHSDHVLLKRIFKPATQNALSQATNTLRLLETVDQLSIFLGPFNKIVSNITQETQNDIVRIHVLHNLDMLLSSHSDSCEFYSSYFCDSSSYLSINEDHILYGSDYPAHWLSCWDTIEVHNPFVSQFNVKLADGMHLRTVHKKTNTTMQSKIQPFDLSLNLGIQ